MARVLLCAGVAVLLLLNLYGADGGASSHNIATLYFLVLQNDAVDLSTPCLVICFQQK